jgi:hypothetical protein
MCDGEMYLSGRLAHETLLVFNLDFRTESLRAADAVRAETVHLISNAF